MDVDKIKELVERKTTYPFQTANLCNTALGEMYYLSPGNYEKTKVGYILSSITMRYYMMSLQYMFNAEYCKLFEKDDNQKTKNVSSLQKLNNYFQKQFGKIFDEIQAKNENILQNILQSDFCLLQRDLRDKKFSHSDKSDLNNFVISPLTDKEINKGFEHLRAGLDIINNCFTMFNGQGYGLVIPNVATSTRTFIEQQTEYQEFYFKAMTGGYEI